MENRRRVAGGSVHDNTTQKWTWNPISPSSPHRHLWNNYACVSVPTKCPFPPLPYPLAQRVRKSVSGALRFSALNWIHACMCVLCEWERMVGHPEHPVCLTRMEYTHHCGMRTLFIAYNGRLSYSHVIWRKRDNLSFCFSIPLKAVKDKIWFMWSPWDTRCAFGDKQEQVHLPLGFC